MAITTLNWTDPANPRLANADNVADSTLIDSSVSLGDSFGPFAMPDDDDCYLALRVESSSGVPGVSEISRFYIVTEASRGTSTVSLAPGNGAKVSVEDMVVIRRGSDNLELFRSRIESKSTDDIELEDRILVDVDTDTTFEIPGKIEVIGTEGTDTGGTTRTRTSTIWLTDTEDRGGWFVTNWKYDHGTNITVNTSGFAASNMRCRRYIDMFNIYRADRNTDRELTDTGSGITAPTNAHLLFDFPFYSHGSGHKTSATGAGSDMFRVAESHPPIRLYVEVNSGSDFTGGVEFYGFRTLWSPIKSAITGGVTTSVNVPIENYNQFFVGDELTLHDLSASTTATWDHVTIQSKTAPNTLTFSAAPINSYTVDDIIGRLESEIVTVGAAGSSPYPTNDSWAYPLTHQATNPDADFNYDVFSTVQGAMGTCRSSEQRNDPGVNTSLAEITPAPMVVSLLGASNSRFSQPFAWGAQVGQYSFPRPRSGNYILYTNNSNTSNGSLTSFGNASDYGVPSKGVSIMTGSVTTADFLWRIRQVAGEVNVVHVFGTQFLQSRGANSLEAGGAAGVISMQDGNRTFARGVLGFAQGSITFTSANLRLQDSQAYYNTGQNSFGTNPGAGVGTIQLAVPTTKTSISNILGFENPANGPRFFPDTDYTGDDTLRLVDYNKTITTGMGTQSQRIELGTRDNSNRNFTAAMVGGYAKNIKSRTSGTTNVDRILESRAFFNLLVISPTGQAVPGATVIIVDSSGTVQVNETTGASGRTSQNEEIISHRWLMRNLQAGDPTWKIEDGDGGITGVTYTDFNDFTLIVHAPGFSRFETTFSIAPILQQEFNLIIALQVPPPDGAPGR